MTLHYVSKVTFPISLVALSDLYCNILTATSNHHNFNLGEILFCSYQNSKEVITTKCCTWQDSSAVVSCAKDVVIWSIGIGSQRSPTSTTILQWAIRVESTQKESDQHVYRKCTYSCTCVLFFFYIPEGLSTASLNNEYRLLNLRILIIMTVYHLICQWISTQNIIPIHWEVCVLYWS